MHAQQEIDITKTNNTVPGKRRKWITYAAGIHQYSADSRSSDDLMSGQTHTTVYVVVISSPGKKHVIVVSTGT
jgi:hypothetical protein